MRVLFDLVHPADALFFFHAIRGLQLRGVDVRLASRRKDVLVGLLDDLQLDHTPVSEAGRGLVGQARELISRDLALFRMARSWKPDVMAGFGGLAISHVGRLLGIRSVSFYDTEHASLQIALTLPFISEWHVPRSWRGRTAPGRTFHFSGSKQFAYLHPDYFRADDEAARQAGWEPGRENFLVRTVAWQASHDRGRSGIGLPRLRRIVEFLSSRGRVHLSAEGDLPSDLEPLRMRCRAAGFHHLLARCRLYCGESITVASEAVALGIPSVLQIDRDYGYVDEQVAAGLIRRVGQDEDPNPVLEQALQQDPRQFRERAGRFAAASIDVNCYIQEVLLDRGGQGSRAGLRATLP